VCVCVCVRACVCVCVGVCVCICVCVCVCIYGAQVRSQKFGHYDEKCDIYSAAVIYWFIASSLSLSLFLSLSHTQNICHLLVYRDLSLSLTHTHTRTRTHTQTLSLSHTHTHAQTHNTLAHTITCTLMAHMNEPWHTFEAHLNTLWHIFMAHMNNSWHALSLSLTLSLINRHTRALHAPTHTHTHGPHLQHICIRHGVHS